MIYILGTLTLLLVIFAVIIVKLYKTMSKRLNFLAEELLFTNIAVKSLSILIQESVDITDLEKQQEEEEGVPIKITIKESTTKH